MSLSNDAVKRLMIATTSAGVGNEVASAVNNAAALGSVAGLAAAKKIVATASDQTTDFASLQLGDKVLHFPVSAGGIEFLVCANVLATGFVTYTTSSGAQVVTINGHAVNFSDAGTDAGNATAAAAAITADTTVGPLVTAVVDGLDNTKVNITAKLAGVVGDYTLAVTGTGAARSAATLTGGAAAGQLPRNAVSGDLYVVLRTVSSPASALKF